MRRWPRSFSPARRHRRKQRRRLPPRCSHPAGRAAGPQGAPAPARGGGGLLAGAGPADKPPVDGAAADRGRTVYGAECVSCHGPQARGTQNGSNLVRSLVVLRDRYGSEIGPLLKRGHKEMMSGRSSTVLTDAQIIDLANFLRQRVNDSLRGSPHFPGAERPDWRCQSRARRFSPARESAARAIRRPGISPGLARGSSRLSCSSGFSFPRRRRGGRGRGRGAGRTISDGRDRDGHSGRRPGGHRGRWCRWTISPSRCATRRATCGRLPGRPALQVVKNDPLAAHRALLDSITDKNMHDVVAYLETLK